MTDPLADAAAAAGFTLNKKLRVKPGGVMRENQTAYDYEARLLLLDAKSGVYCGYIDLYIRQRHWDPSSGASVPGEVCLSMPWYVGTGPYLSVKLDPEKVESLGAVITELFKQTGMELVLSEAHNEPS